MAKETKKPKTNQSSFERFRLLAQKVVAAPKLKNDQASEHGKKD